MNLSILNKQSGVGLIEVMVSLIVLALGILGFIALQLRSVSATSQSLAYTESLSNVRDLAERIRANPGAIDTYEDAITDANLTKPAKSCGAYKDTGTVSLCSHTEIAEADVYAIRKQLEDVDLKLGMITCPDTDDNGILKTQCLIAAWGNTEPTIGTKDGSDDDEVVSCINSATGKYFIKSECIILEASS